MGKCKNSQSRIWLNSSKVSVARASEACKGRFFRIQFCGASFVLQGCLSTFFKIAKSFFGVFFESCRLQLVFVRMAVLRFV